MKVRNKIKFRHCEHSEAIHTPGRRHSGAREAIQFNKRTPRRSQVCSAFTIVELLVVIVVIAILAVITIVSYTNITKRATLSALSSDLNQANKALQVYQETSNTETYPATLDSLGLKLSSNINYDYQITASSKNYCLQGTVNGVTKSISGDFQSISSSSCTVITGLVGWWKLNGSATDSSGSGNNGIIYGATSTTGANYSFTGDEYIYINYSPSFKDIKSVSFWLYMNGSSATSFQGIIGRGLSFGWGVYTGNNGLPLTIRIMGVNLNVSINLNEWSYITFTYDNSILNIYKNGSLYSTTSVGSTLNDNTSYGMGFGKIPDRGIIDGTNYQSNCKLDDIRVYNRILSASEAQGLYDAGAQ